MKRDIFFSTGSKGFSNDSSVLSFAGQRKKKKKKNAAVRSSAEKPQKKYKEIKNYERRNILFFTESADCDRIRRVPALILYRW